MASDTTPLRGRPYPAESDIPDVAADLHALAVSVDTAPTVGVGVLSSRPSSATNGDRYYVTGDPTPANNAVEWIWSSGAWVQANSDPLIGTMTMWSPPSAPTDTRWHLCDGSAVSRTTYAALFALIGSTYGIGDGSTTFNLPSMVGRFPLGKTPSGTGSVLGGFGGALDHNHTIPPLAIPGLGIPALYVPPETVTVGGTLTLTGAWAAIMATNFGSDDLLCWAQVDPGNWTSDRFVGASGNVNTGNIVQGHATGVYGYATGELTGGTSGTYTGGGTTYGSATPASGTGTSNPPFLAVNYIIRII